FVLMSVNKQSGAVSEFHTELSVAMAHDSGNHFTPEHCSRLLRFLIKIHLSSLTSPDRDRQQKTVDTARAAIWQCRCRGARHGAQLLHARIRNKSEQNDKTAAATARLLLCRTSKAK